MVLDYICRLVEFIRKNADIISLISIVISLNTYYLNKKKQKIEEKIMNSAKVIVKHRQFSEFSGDYIILSNVGKAVAKNINIKFEEDIDIIDEDNLLPLKLLYDNSNDIVFPIKNNNSLAICNVVVEWEDNMGKKEYKKSIQLIKPWMYNQIINSVNKI